MYVDLTWMLRMHTVTWKLTKIYDSFQSAYIFIRSYKFQLYYNRHEIFEKSNNVLLSWFTFKCKCSLKNAVKIMKFSESYHFKEIKSVQKSLLFITCYRFIHNYFLREKCSNICDSSVWPRWYKRVKSSQNCQRFNSSTVKCT